MKIQAYLLVLFVLFFAACDSNENYSLKEIFQLEKQKENRAKEGNNATPIRRISNKDSIDLISLEIQAIINEEKKLHDSLERIPKSIGIRFKQGDNSVLQEILTCLKGKDKDARHEIYSDLQDDYENRGTQRISDPRLVKVLFANLYLEEDQEELIQLLGYNKVKGCNVHFEKVLLTSKKPGRILYWLSAEGMSQIAFNYLKSGILNGHLKLDDSDWTLSSLENFLKEGNTNIKIQANQLLYDIYKRKLISAKDFERSENEYSSDNPALVVIKGLLNQSSPEIIPIAEAFKDHKFLGNEAHLALIRLNKEDAMNYIEKMAESSDKFSQLMLQLPQLKSKISLENLKSILFTSYQKYADKNPTITEDFVFALIELNLANELNNLEKWIDDEKVLNRLKNYWKIQQMKPEKIAEEWVKAGFIPKEISKENLSKFNSDWKYGRSNPAWTLLNYSGISYGFDLETALVPVPYNELLTDLVKLGGSKLEGLVFAQKVNEINEGESFDYTLWAKVNNNLFECKPEDIGDWYDLTVVLNLLNLVCQEKGIQERFISLPDTDSQWTELVFMDPKKFDKFYQTYLQH